MKHVFVETNWVFEFCAPAHRSTPEAQDLAARAGRGELVLHVPAVSLREGANAIRQKCQPKATELQEFRRWAAANGKLNTQTNSEAIRFLGAYVASVQADMTTLEDRIDGIPALARRGRVRARSADARPRHRLAPRGGHLEAVR